MDFLDEEVAEDTDERSIFVKNVDFSADAQEVKDHFKECGEIKRVTILMDKYS
jgi:polyadenylate-binding protein 2